MDTKQSKALELIQHMHDEWPEDWHQAAIESELRRLHEVNVELLEALQLALSAHGKVLLSDPPQEAWKTYGVEAKARAAIAKATGEANG